jgi:hypothetical protein
MKYCVQMNGLKPSPSVRISECKYVRPPDSSHKSLNVRRFDLTPGLTQWHSFYFWFPSALYNTQTKLGHIKGTKHTSRKHKVYIFQYNPIIYLNCFPARFIFHDIPGKHDCACISVECLLNFFTLSIDLPFI